MFLGSIASMTSNLITLQGEINSVCNTKAQWHRLSTAPAKTGIISFAGSPNRTAKNQIVLTTLTLLLIGFSVVTCVMLQLVYCLFLPNLRKSWLSMLACCLLLSALAALQILHAEHLLSGLHLVSLQPYLSLLFLVPTAFFFFSRAVLLPDHPSRPILLLHWVPFVASVFIASLVELPAAFLLGAAYCVWLSRKIYGMRTQRSRFRFEIFFFGLFSLLAIGVLLLGFAINQIDQSTFVLAHANAIGLALVLVVAALIIFPELLSDIDAIAKLAYANSTLTHVDTRAAVTRLETLMKSEKIFQNEELSLSVLAEQLADSVNHMLVVGFYLLNLGFVLFKMRTNVDIPNFEQMLVYLSSSIGFVLMVLGAAHFFNLYVISMFRRSQMNKKHQAV